MGFRLVRHVFLVAALMAVHTSAATAGRSGITHGNNFVPRAGAGIVATPATAEDILACLLGPNIVAFNVQLSASTDAAGTFTGGGDVVGFDSGVVLSTGNVAFVAGPNLQDDVSQINGTPGDADLDALIPGFSTLDAAILEFDFTCADALQLTFSYVFASDEYNEYVDSDYNDVFAFFLNGTNIGDNVAAVPGICSDPGLPVTINTVNCSNPYAPPVGLNCNCYRNNDVQDGGGTINTEMDGLTEAFTISATVNAGVNHIKIAIADAGDDIYDSNVFLKCQSFECGAAPLIGACCIPDGGCVVTTAQDCAQVGGQYMGDGVVCSPDPCEALPTREKSWGQIKSSYR